MPPLGPHPLAPPAPRPQPQPQPKPVAAGYPNPFAFKAPAPFAGVQRQAAQQTRQAANRLPSRPSLPIVPALKSYTPKQADYIRQRVAPVVAHAIVNEGHAQAYIDEAAQHERQGGSAQDATTPFARMLRNSNAQERQTLHAFERVGGAQPINDAVEQTRREQLRQQLAAALNGHASKQVADDLHQRGYFTPASSLPLHLLPTSATATPKAQALLGFQPDKPYRGPEVGVATSFQKAGPVALAATTAAKLVPKGSFPSKVFTDIADTTTGALPSYIQTGLNLGNAALAPFGAGSAKPLEQMGKQAVHGFLHPDFANHPVSSALQYLPIAAAGSALGRLGRTGAFGERAAQVASTERAPLVAYHREGFPGQPAPAPVQAPRSFSGNVFVKSAQAAAEEARRRVLKQDPNVVTGARLQAMLGGGSEITHAAANRGLLADVLPGAVRPGLLDKEAASQEAQRRLLASQHVAAMPSDRARIADAIPLITEGIVRRPATLLTDLQAEVDRLTHAQQHYELQGRDLAQNREQIAQVQGVLDAARGGMDLGPAFEAARQYNQAHGDLSDELARLGGVHPDALRAKYVPIALAHGGAVTAEQATERYGNALTAFRQARSDLAAASENRDTVAARDAGERMAVARELMFRWGPHSEEQLAPVARAQALEQAARSRAKEAEGRHVAAVRARDRLVGQQQVQRGARPGEALSAGPRPTRGGQPVYSPGELVREDRQVAMDRANALIDSRKAERDTHNQNWKQAREATQQARQALGPGRTGLRKADGSPFTTQELHDLAMRETEDRGVGFLTQRPAQSFSGAVRSRLVRGRAGTTYKPRGGSSFLTGTYDRSYPALQRQMYETANRVSSHRAANAIANRFGFGRFDTEADAQRAAENFRFTPEGERLDQVGGVVPWHIGPEPTVGLTHTGTAQTLAGDVHSTFEETPQGKHTLLPQAIVARMKEHDALATQGRSIMNRYTSAWRNAQLFTSPRWVFGNPQENAIRVAAEGANPAGMFGRGSSFRVGRAMLDHWNAVKDAPDAQLEQMGIIPPGAPAGAAEMARQVARAHSAAYDAGAHFGSIAVNAIRQGDKLPSELPTGASHLVRFWQGWRTKLGHWQSAAERNAKLTVLGKIERRELAGFMGKVGKLNDDQVRIAQKAATGKLDPNEAAAHADRVMRAVGNWTALTPKVRKAVQRYTPFGLWWLNSMKFLGRMPFDHPFVTAATVAAERGTQGQRPDPGKDFLAGGLHVKLPVVGGATLDPTYYSPGGVFIDPYRTAYDMWMPQMASLATAALGVGPFPDKRGNFPALKAPGGSTGKGQPLTIAQRAIPIINAIAQGITPGARQAQTILERGGHPFGTANLISDALGRVGLGPSQVTPGTQRSTAQVAAKLLFPTRITLDPATAASGKPGKLPPGVTQAEIDHYVQQAQQQAQQAQGQAAPGISQGELNYYLRQAQAATK